jgi:hypothetical protein
VLVGAADVGQVRCSIYRAYAFDEPSGCADRCKRAAVSSGGAGGNETTHTDCPDLQNMLERIVERGIRVWLFRFRAALIWCWHVWVKQRGPNKDKVQGHPC